MNPTLTTVLGRPMLVNSDDACLSSWLLELHKWDDSEIMLIRQTVKPGAVVVDVGANIGYYTMLLAELVGPTGRVYAFEPEPDNYGLLLENIKLRGFENVVTAEPLALFSRPGEMTLYSGGPNCGAHSLVYDAGQHKTWTVPVSTYDIYLGDRARDVSFVKIDAEGAEAEILAGAESIFAPGARAPHALMLEYNDMMQSRAGRSMRDALSRLIDAGFMTSLIANNAAGMFGKSYFDTLFEKLRGLYVNLWCERRAA